MMIANRLASFAHDEAGNSEADSDGKGVNGLFSNGTDIARIASDPSDNGEASHDVERVGIPLPPAKIDRKRDNCADGCDVNVAHLDGAIDDIMGYIPPPLPSGLRWILSRRSPDDGNGGIPSRTDQEACQTSLPDHRQPETEQRADGNFGIQRRGV